MDEEPKDVRIPIMMERSLVGQIDQWRRGQQRLPARSEAIRELLRKALKAEGLG